MSDHTSGPWHVDDTDGATVRSPDGLAVHCDADSRLSAAVLQANSRLIAAAPDLLAVAEQVVAIAQTQPGTVVDEAQYVALYLAARTALEKAQGFSVEAFSEEHAMPEPCGCSPTARCARAWQFREEFRSLPVEGTSAQRLAQHQIALAYTHHLEQAGAYTHHHLGLMYPLWPTCAYGGPPELAAIRAEADMLIASDAARRQRLGLEEHDDA